MLSRFKNQTGWGFRLCTNIVPSYLSHLEMKFWPLPPDSRHHSITNEQVPLDPIVAVCPRKLIWNVRKERADAEVLF